MLKLSSKTLLLALSLGTVCFLFIYFQAPSTAVETTVFTLYDGEPQIFSSKRASITTTPRRLINSSNNLLDELPSAPGDDFQFIFNERRLRLSDACQRRMSYRPGSTPEHLRELVNLLETQKAAQTNLLVDDRNGVIFCKIPKVASTTWMKVFTVLHTLSGADNKMSVAGDIEAPPSLNFTRVEQIDDDLVNSPSLWPTLSPLKPLSSFTKTQRATRLRRYKKVMWVRHPLMRLVSAYRSKLVDENSFYARAYGSEILKKYRPKAKLNETATGKGVTLEEFLRFLVDLPKYYVGDVHWAVYNSHCWPCFFYPDYIGHFESLKPEADFVIDQLYPNFGNKFKFPEPTKNIQVDGTLEADLKRLRKVPKSVLKNVIAKYETDFDMFGYKINPDWT